MSAKLLRVSPYKDDELNLPVGDVDDAIPFYQDVMGFAVESRSDSPVRSAVLIRDDVRIGLAENGGDPNQEGCFFEVDDVEATFAELKDNGLGSDSANYKVETHGENTYKLFFVIAPDGLCYCLGQRQ
ncbi:MAG: VOC family protein [Pirellulaceae bacterium]